MKKVRLFVLFLSCFIQLGIAQPPPPHPGGSGNQNAPIPVVLLVLSSLTAGLYYVYKRGFFDSVKDTNGNTLKK